MISNHIEQRVMKEINEGRVEMRSRRSFTLGRVALVFSLVSACLLMFVFVSFILHALQRSGVLYLPTFGVGVVRYLLHPFSWFILSLIVITNVIAVVMAFVIDRSTTAYRAPFLYVWAAVFLFVTAGAVAVFITPFHDWAHSIASKWNLPVIESLYRTATEETDAHTATGLVRSVHPGGFELVGFSRKVLGVVVDESTVVIDDAAVQDGEVVIVVGESNGRTIVAKYVRRYPGALSDEEMTELKRVGTSE